ncbi:MAG: DsbA family oxidoreductase [Proteobacteria bacterium]|nr:DsbA family oxidoreductase [Pseudomonadota bacterium]
MVSIEIFSDVVCPWCLIGKRNLEAAITQLAAKHEEAKNIKIKWRSFQLNPQLPPSGISRAEYTSSKFGGAERAAIVYDRIQRSGQEVGLELHFDKIKNQPNSAILHALVYAAETIQRDHDFIENLFKAFFIDGLDLTNRANIVALATDIGLCKTDIEAVLNDGLFMDKIKEDIERSTRLGIQGVPFFIINESIGLSGAQPPDAIVKTIERSLQQS